MRGSRSVPRWRRGASPDDRLDGGDEALLVEKNLALRQVDVDVEGGGQAGRGRRTGALLGQHRRVHVVGRVSRKRLDEALVDEEEEVRLLRRPVRADHLPLHREAELGVGAVDLEQLNAAPWVWRACRACRARARVRSAADRPPSARGSDARVVDDVHHRSSLPYSSPAPSSPSAASARCRPYTRRRSACRVPAHGFGRRPRPAAPRRGGRRRSTRYAHGAPSVIDVIVTCATCEIDASASPRKPKVSIDSRSSYAASFEVAKRSHTRP